LQDNKAIIALVGGKEKREQAEFRICFLLFSFFAKTGKNAKFTH